MFLLSASSRLPVWLCILSCTVFLVWRDQCAEVGQVRGVGPLRNADSLFPVTRLHTSNRGWGQPVGVRPPYRGLLGNLSWLRRLSAAGDLAAASVLSSGGRVKTTGLPDKRGGKALLAGRLVGTLSASDGSDGSLQGNESNRNASRGRCPHELRSHGVAPAKCVQASVWPRVSPALAAAGGYGGPWLLANRNWQRRARTFGLQVFYRDAGGGGDCLFLCVAAALRSLERQIPRLKSLSGEHLRQMTASAFVGRNLLTGTGTLEERKTFWDRMTLLTAVEDAGDWKDGWSPTAIVNQQEYVDSLGERRWTRTVEEKARAVYYELSRPGGAHWGDCSDVRLLEEELNIGIILFNEGGTVYAFASDLTKQREAYILLHYWDSVHFQEAGIGESSENVRSAFLAKEVPDFIHCVHLADTHHPLPHAGSLPLLDPSE